MSMEKRTQTTKGLYIFFFGVRMFSRVDEYALRLWRIFVDFLPQYLSFSFLSLVFLYLCFSLSVSLPVSLSLPLPLFFRGSQ